MNVPHLVLFPLVLAVSAAGVVLWLSALVSVMRNAVAWRAVTWVVVTFAFPVLGPVVWFLVGRGHERALTAATYLDHLDPHAGLAAR